MKDDAKTKKQLISELKEIRQFVAELLNEYHDIQDLSDLNHFKEAAINMRKDQEIFMKSFSQNALAMALASRKESCLVEVNEAFLKLSGFKRREVIGNTVTGLGLITDEQRTAILDQLNNKGRIENYEVEFLTKNRKKIRGLINAVMMTIGREKFSLVIMTDITHLKQTKKMQKAGMPESCHLPINTPMPWFIN